MTDLDFKKLEAFFPQVNLNDENASHFRGFWETKTFKQREYITEAGNIENYFYFVLEGVQAIYLLNEKGQKVVLGFSYAGSPSGVFDSFVSRNPSVTFLEALKPSTLLAISLSGYQELFEKYPVFHQ